MQIHKASCLTLHNNVSYGKIMILTNMNRVVFAESEMISFRRKI